MPSSALETLYREQQPWLRSWLQRRVGCPAQAADLAQDTFFKLLLKPREFPSSDDARAFLTTVAKGLYIDQWRRKQVEQAWLEAQAQHSLVDDVSALQQATILDALVLLDKALSQLPEDVSEAFIRSQLQGYSYAELAREMKLCERTIKRYVAKALAHCTLLIEP